MWEFASRNVPYAAASPTIISAVVPLGEREDIPQGCPPGYTDLMQQCWAQDPEARPEVDQVLIEITRIHSNVPPDQ